MDCVGIEELKCKLALLFGIQASQIGDIFMLGPSAIHIMVTDEVSPVCGVLCLSVHVCCTCQCMYMCVCVSVRTSVFVGIGVCTCACQCMYMCVSGYVHGCFGCVRVCTCVGVSSVCTYVVVCVCACHCMYMCMCASVYVHVCLCEEADGQGLTVSMSFLTVVRIVILFPASVPFSYL